MTSDYDYINLQATNTTNEARQMFFETSLLQPFNITGKKACVVRFSLPTHLLPIFEFNDNNYFFTLSHLTYSVNIPVVFESRSSFTGFKGVYQIQHFIDMLNTTLANAVTALKLLDVSLSTMTTPYFVINLPTGSITLYCEASFFGDTVTNPVKLFANNLLMIKIFGLPYRLNTNNVGFEYQLMIYDTKNNSETISNVLYYKMTTQAPIMDNLSDIERIIFSTNLPIKNETLADASYMPILTDFQLSDLDINTFYNRISYSPAHNYRKVDVKTNVPINKVQINVYYVDVSGNPKPLYMARGTTGNIKIQFVN